MRRGLIVLAAAALAVASWQRAEGAIRASATLTSEQLGANSYQYSLTLTNNGTTPIGTYWFAWLPFYDLLPSEPTQIGSPTGWNGIPAPDYYGVASVQWVNTATPLQPGKSLSGFTFDSPDSPSVISGKSFFAGYPVETSYVYMGAPQAPGDPGFSFTTATVVPEPTGIALLMPAALLLRRRRR